MNRREFLNIGLAIGVATRLAGVKRILARVLQDTSHTTTLQENKLTPSLYDLPVSESSSLSESSPPWVPSLYPYEIINAVDEIMNHATKAFNGRSGTVTMRSYNTSVPPLGSVTTTVKSSLQGYSITLTQDRGDDPDIIIKLKISIEPIFKIETIDTIWMPPVPGGRRKKAVFMDLDDFCKYIAKNGLTRDISDLLTKATNPKTVSFSYLH